MHCNFVKISPELTNLSNTQKKITTQNTMNNAASGPILLCKLGWYSVVVADKTFLVVTVAQHLSPTSRRFLAMWKKS